MSAQVSTTDLGKNQVIDGKYRIERQLGAGGMGAVYEAVHLGTSRKVALKVIVSTALASEPEVVTRFHREAKASGAIDSDHVVQVLDTGVDPLSNNPYMVMEYLSGEDVITLVRRVGPLAPDVVVRIGAQACLGLQRAHDAGIIHRDIKSANMFLARRDGGEVFVKILDFGIAKVRAEPIPDGGTDHGLTTTGSMIGSPLYMSPEQARAQKKLDGRADLWSLAVVLYEALTGRTPNHDKDTLGDLLIAICVDPTPPLQSRAPWVRSELAAIIERALEKDPARRFQTAAEMHAALVALAPNGTKVHESMLVAISDDARAYVAPRAPSAVATGPGAVAAPPPGAFAPPLSTSSGAQLAAGITNPELGASTGGAPAKRASNAYWGLAVVPILVIATVIGLAVRGKKHDIAAIGMVQSEPSASVSVASSPSAPPALPPPSSAPVTPIARAARVAVVAPAGASVEIDGKATAIESGAVPINGAPGSLHKVRVAHGTMTKDVDVTILDNGTTLPAKIELASAPTGNVNGNAKAGPVKPAGEKKPGSGTPAGAVGAAPATNPNEPAIKQTF